MILRITIKLLIEIRLSGCRTRKNEEITNKKEKIIKNVIFLHCASSTISTRNFIGITEHAYFVAYNESR